MSDEYPLPLSDGTRHVRLDIETKQSSNFDTHLSEQLDLDSYSDVTSQSFHQRAIVQSSPLGLSQVVSEISTPSTLSSGTITDSLSPKPDTPLQVVEYNHTKTYKKPEAKRNQKATPRAKERKSRGFTSRPDALKTDTTPKTAVKRDVNGKIAGTVAIFGLNQIIRAPMNSESQLATSITRRFGACLKCHHNRQRCDMPENVYDPCSRCKKLLVNIRMQHAGNFSYQPCIRVSILDLRLHRKGPTIYDDLHIWVQRKQKLLSLQINNATHDIFLTQGFGEGIYNALSLRVSRFEPGPGDRTAYFWTDSSGQPRSMEMPPYFISDMEAARQSIHRFLYDARSTYLETLLADSNPIIRQTFQAALIYKAFSQSMLVSEALDTWVAARFIESHWRIFCGGAIIGLEPTDEPGHPYNGFIPVTPIMDTQLDDLVIRDLLTPLTSRFLKRLSAKIDERKRENWLEIYLAMFIMMSNIGWILKDMMAMTRWKGLKSGSRGGTLTQGYIHACKTMLAYFHFACAGSVPLSTLFSKLSGSDRNYYGMTLEQINYLGSIKHEVVRQEAKLSKWKELSMYNDEMYWCYQMLCQDWQGDIPYVGEIDDFREDDFLSSSGV